MHGRGCSRRAPVGYVPLAQFVNALGNPRLGAPQVELGALGIAHTPCRSKSGIVKVLGTATPPALPQSPQEGCPQGWLKVLGCGCLLPLLACLDYEPTHCRSIGRCTGSPLAKAEAAESLGPARSTKPLPTGSLGVVMRTSHKGTKDAAHEFGMNNVTICHLPTGTTWKYSVYTSVDIDVQSSTTNLLTLAEDKKK